MKKIELKFRKDFKLSDYDVLDDIVITFTNCDDVITCGKVNATTYNGGNAITYGSAAATAYGLGNATAYGNGNAIVCGNGVSTATTHGKGQGWVWV
jgi:hypothetical protein